MATQRSYVLVNRDLLESLAGELGAETGNTITVKRRDPIYADVLDEDGEPTGEQQRAGWGEPYDVEVSEIGGGYALVGRTPGDRYSAIILVSPQAEGLFGQVKPGWTIGTDSVGGP